MSLISKLTLGSSVVFAITMVSYVHFKQKYDDMQMKEGIIKDMARQKDKKAKNLKALQSQQDFEKALKDQRNKDLTEQESETKS